MGEFKLESHGFAWFFAALFWVLNLIFFIRKIAEKKSDRKGGLVKRARASRREQGRGTGGDKKDKET